MKKHLRLYRQKMRRLFYRVRFFLIPNSLPKNADGRIYLNLGCGDRTSSEFINIDAVPSNVTHYVRPIEDLSIFPASTVDMIYASHIIEHIDRSRLHSTLQEWCRVLKPGGILRFGVPDFEALIEMYLASNREVDSIVAQLMGGDSGYDDHHSIWNYDFALRVMQEAGFSVVRHWDIKSADHHAFKDKTARVFRVGDRVIPFSLNLEAIK